MSVWLAEQSAYIIFSGLCVLAFAVQGWWLRSRKSVRLPGLVWLLAAALLLFGWFTADQAGDRERNRIQSLMQDFAKLYGHEIELAGHSNLPDKFSKDDPLYLRLIDLEKQWLSLNPDVEDIYTIRKRPNGENVFIVDSETDYNRNGKYDEAREQRTTPGEVYDKFDAGLESAFRGTANFTAVPITDRWGTWISAFVPLTNSAGKVEAVLGVDFGARSFSSAIAHSRRRVIGMVALIQVILLVSSTLNLALKAEIAERKRAEVSLKETGALLETILHNMTDFVYFKDRQSRFIHCSQALVKHVGFTDPAALKGKTDFDCYTEEHARLAFNSEREILQTGKPIINLEEKETHSDGRVTWVLTSKVPWKDARGDIIGTWGISRDITDLKCAEDRLRLLSSALQQTNEPVIITDAELERPGPRIVFVNPAFTQMTGYEPEEVLGKTPRLLQGPHSNRVVLAQLKENLKNGEPFAGETVNYRKDGSEFPIEWHIAPVKGTDGKVEHFIGIQRDITERKRVEAQLIQSQKQEMVGKLAAGIAHEFNNIMTVIIGHSDLLIAEAVPDDPTSRSLRQIRIAAKRAAVLTQKLLAYGSKQHLRPEILDLNRILVNLEGFLRHLAGKNIDLDVIITDDPAIIKVDASQIEQVIINLVMNAVEAMAEGGSLTISTSHAVANRPPGAAELRSAAREVVLTISDTGVGMTDEVRSRVFEPFFTTKDVGKGTGLGLATSQGIVNQSGGHITVSSSPGKGSCFKLYFPEIIAAVKSASLKPLRADISAAPQ